MMKKRKLKDMSDDELDKDILVRENLEVKRKMMRMTEEMEYLRKEMEKLKEEQRDWRGFLLQHVEAQKKNLTGLCENFRQIFTIF